MFRQRAFLRCISRMCCSLALTLAPVTLYSQSEMGEIRLQVKDPSDAPMQASGRLRSLSTGSVRSFQTDPQGNVTLGTLPFGHYRVEVSRRGFATQLILIDIQSKAPISQIIILSLGTSSYSVDVVGTTPLPGLDRSIDEIPAPTQAATERDIELSGALNLPDFLNRRFNGIYLNEIQGNPY